MISCITTWFKDFEWEEGKVKCLFRAIFYREFPVYVSENFLGQARQQSNDTAIQQYKPNSTIL